MNIQLRGTVFAILVVIWITGSSKIVLAQNIELTPFSGFRIGGNFEDSVTGTSIDIDESEAYGMAVDLFTTPNTTLQLLYSHQSTQLKTKGPVSGVNMTGLDVDYIHIGGSYIFDHQKNLRPYIGASLGFTVMRPDQPSLESETRFSFGLAGGIKYFFNRYLGIRLEAKGYSTVMEGDTQIFCSGGCNIQFRGDALWQFESNAGVIFAF